VGTTPLDGIKVVLSSPANIRGALRVDGNAQVDLSQLYVSLSEENPADPERMWGRGVQVTARDGTFEMSDVPPGDYRLEVGARGRGLEDWYTKSVHFGSRDVTDSLLQVTGGGTVPLDVLISPAGATIQGVVKDANDHPVSAAMVVTVPQGKHSDRFDLYQTAATDQQGTFKIRGAAPGTYKVFAWEDVDNEAWFDPDFMKNYESQGTSVSVNEWDRSTLSLRVIPSSKK
jgi:protocatechuate 3,4-dioxygenase beta subunit